MGPAAMQSGVFSSQDAVFMNILEGRFTTPTGNYFWDRKRRKFLQILARYLQKLPSTATTNEPRLFVELGSGQGADLILIWEMMQKQLNPWELVALEADPTRFAILELKKEHLRADNLRLLPQDVTRPLPFEDGTVDLIYCSEVIEHLLDPDAFLQEISRVLKKPGGSLLLTTPNQPNLFQRSYWSRKRRQKLEDEMAALRETPLDSEGSSEDLLFYGHVSLRTNRQWDEALVKVGMQLVDYERGGMTYGATGFMDREFVMALRFMAEGVLDLLPKAWTRDFSDQLIALYQIP